MSKINPLMLKDKDKTDLPVISGERRFDNDIVFALSPTESLCRVHLARVVRIYE